MLSIRFRALRRAGLLIAAYVAEGVRRLFASGRRDLAFRWRRLRWYCVRCQASVRICIVLWRWLWAVEPRTRAPLHLRRRLRGRALRGNGRECKTRWRISLGSLVLR